MKTLVLAVLLLLPFGVCAQEDYDLGTYWTVTGVDTKPGHFDDYLTDLNKVWRKSIEMLKSDGKVVSYQMFSNTHARVGEPDLWLLVEWKSGAEMMDTPREYWDAQSKKLFGSLDQGDEANINRGELRTILSDVLMREMSFK